MLKVFSSVCWKYIIHAVYILKVSLSDLLCLSALWKWVSHVALCSEPLWHSLRWYWHDRLIVGSALQFPWQMFALTISHSSRRHSTRVAHLHPSWWHDLPEVGGACWAQWPNYAVWGEPMETPLLTWLTHFTEQHRCTLMYIGHLFYMIKQMTP